MKYSLLIMLAAMLPLGGCDLAENHLRTGVSGPVKVCDGYVCHIGEANTEDQIKLLVVPTASPEASLRLLNTGILDLAVVETDVLVSALERQRANSQEARYAALTGVFREYCHVISRADSKLVSINDLIGKRVALGNPDSGTYRTAINVLRAHGINSHMFTPLPVSGDDAAQMLERGEVDAVFVNDRHPSQWLKDLAARLPVKFLILDAEALNSLPQDRTGYQDVVISADTYAGQHEDIRTIAVWNMLIAGQEVEDEDIHKILHSFFHHRLHQETARSTDANSDETSKNIIEVMSRKGLKLPFHPGVAEFYKKHGIEVELQENSGGLFWVIAGQD